MSITKDIVSDIVQTVTKGIVAEQTVSLLDGPGAWNASSGDVELGSQFDTLLNASDFSVSFWFALNNATITQALIGNEGTPVSSSGFYIRTDGNGTNIIVVKSGGGFTSTLLTPAANTWGHIVLTRDAGTNQGQIFLDTTSGGTFSMASDLRRNSRFDYFAAENNRRFLGTLRGVQWFNSVLSSGDISDLFSAQGEPIVHANNYAYHRGNGNTSAEWVDEVGGRDGTISGTMAEASGPAPA